MTHFVFAYGTLRAGEINDLANHAATRGLPPPRLLGQARAPGRLVDFGDWPGLIVDADGPGVVGDVYEVDESLIALMDEIEEYVPEGDSCFVRRPIRLEVGGRHLDCLYYPIDPGHAGGTTPIAGDDWIAHRRARSTR